VPTQPPIEWTLRIFALGYSHSGVKLTRPPSSAEVKNDLSYNPSPLCLHNMHRENLYLTFTLHYFTTYIFKDPVPMSQTVLHLHYEDRSFNVGQENNLFVVRIVWRKKKNTHAHAHREREREREREYIYFFFAVVLRPNVGHGLILEVSRSHMTHHSR